MQYSTLITALVVAASLSTEVAARGGKGGNGFRGGKGGQQNAAAAAGQGQGAAAQQAAAAKAQAAAAQASAAAAAKGGKGGKAGKAAAAAAGAAAGAAGGAAAAGAAGAASSAAGAANGNLQINPAVIQTASAQDGSVGASAGQANSLTSNNNFADFCAGKTLTEGKQQVGGSCNPIPMGQIAPQTNMPSTIITSPSNGQNVAANQDLTMVANIKNIQTGTFTNPDTTYYSAPQALNGQNNIIGHTHFTVQDMGGSANPQAALDPTKFAFFKGIDGAADGAGNVAVTVEGGLPAGNYRVCTMSSAANHQPVLVAVAQRGAQDDCVRFTVGGAGNGAAAAAGANGAAAAGANGAAAAGANGAADAAAGGAAGGAAGAAAGAAAAKAKGAAAQKAAAAQQKAAAAGQQGGKGGKGGKGKRARFGRHARALYAEEVD